MSLYQLGDEQQASLQKIRKRVIEAIGKNMDLYGITLSAGHLYGLLFFADKPMTLDEMGREMEMSKTSMSTGVRTLLDLKMVNKVWSKGSRKDLYEVEYDWHQTFTDFFAIKWRKAVETNLLVLRKAIDELDKLMNQGEEYEEFKAILQQDRMKMKQAIAYYKWLDRLIDSMESEEIYKLIPKEEVRD
ncbi:GbsR/MarR family transcriptional regulator [Paenibacillus polymyxa]|uniref:GbsR/MarR family transcriptional regulator n=1 Tax=Paenibacillus polymyxa TaxID=1406 RepID=UPI002025B055|nr:GbsR/MarR family transcriptional regulator [Paenibacillus polymyxa]WDZ55592.1 GbsR/MarR family transcriptional regulator [Paenibacillus polymyxa]